MTSLRVLLVSDALGNAGAERQLALLTASLPHGYEPAVFTIDEEDGHFSSVLRAKGIQVEVMPRGSRFDLTPAARMWSAAARIRPHVVHSWGWMSSAAMLPYCRTHGIPLVDGTIRTGRLPSKRPWANRLSVALADRVVANSAAGLRAFGVAESRGRVVYNGFDTSRLAAADEARATAPARHGRTVVVMAARMYPEKDWAALFQAARTLSREEAGGWRFVAIGDGPERESLRAQCADLISAGVLEFMEGVTDVVPIVATADIGVLLTNAAIAAEGCSNTLMEYMACGLPAVCTNTGGNPEVVAEGRTGYLVAPADAEALAGRLRELRERPAEARALGEAGRQRLLECFSVKTMVEGFVSVYEWALGR